MRVAPLVQLSPAQRVPLAKAARSTSGAVRFAQRAKIILLAAEGRQDIAIAQALGITRQKSARWRARFVELGIDGLRQDASRPGRKKQIGPDQTKAVVRKPWSNDRPTRRTGARARWPGPAG